MSKQKKHNKFKLDNNAQIVLGVIIVVGGVFALSYNYFLEKKSRVFDLMNIAMFQNEMPQDIISNEKSEIKNDEIKPVDNKKNNSSNKKSNNSGSNNQVPKQTNNQTSGRYDYIGYLEVPKVNLKKGFLNINSPYNNIDYNVSIIKTSLFPDVKNGNFILAAHSGNAAISYFRNLYKLKKGDIANVYYKKKKYIYKLVKSYNQPKTGKLSIYRNYNKNTLTLITCTKDNKKSQTLHIFELSKVENF